jgi:hypothetical protein
MPVGVLGGDAGGAEGEIHKRKLLCKVSRGSSRTVEVEGVSNVSVISLLPVSDVLISEDSPRSLFVCTKPSIYSYIRIYINI